MGELHIIDLKQFIDENKCKIYIETGTGICVCLQHALKYNFKKFYSVDIDEEIYLSAKSKITDSRVKFYNKNSVEALVEILDVIPKDEPILFFLDAHFPGADFHKITYEESIRQYKEKSMPLLDEIKTIKKNRDINKDVFIIDDWKLYDDSLKYEFPGWDYKHVQIEENVNNSKEEILFEFEKTHKHFINLRHQGFLILTPR